MSCILQELCGGQSGDSSTDDCDMSGRLGGGKTFVHDVEELTVVGVLEALVQRVSKDPSDGKHHEPDQNQRS